MSQFVSLSIQRVLRSKLPGCFQRSNAKFHLATIGCYFQSHYNQVDFVLARMSYHSSSHACFAKGNKKDAKKGGSDEEVEVTLPNIKDIEKTMEDKVSRFADELSKIRGGKASPDIFNSVYVEAYGSKVPMAEAGQVTLKAANKLNIALFDPELATPVSNAIRDLGLSLNPVIEGNNVTVNIPKPSKEARDNLIKLASKVSEKAKQDVRQVRKDQLDYLKKIKASISEDDSRKLTKTIDVSTEKFIDKVSKLLKEKEKEISSE